MAGVVTSALGWSLVLACAVAPAAAQQADWPSFRKADSDSNGVISMDEARSVRGLGETLADHDKNGDGRLSRSEYETAKRAAGRKAGGAGRPR